MQQFEYIILEVSNDCEFAFFECSNGDYGVLEPLNCEVAVGDVLQSTNSKAIPCCGSQFLVLNGKKQVKIHIDELDFKDGAYKLFMELSKK